MVQYTAMDADELRLLTEALEQAVRSPGPGGMRHAVSEFGWQDLFESEPAVAVSALAELQGEHLTDTTLIDDMVPSGGARVLYPGPGQDEPTSSLRGSTLSARGLLVADGSDRVLVPALRDAELVVVSTALPPLVGAEERAGMAPDSGWRLITAEIELPEATEVTAGSDARELWTAIRAAGHRAIAHELIGIGRRMLDLALEHVSTREQFGSPLGRFQAVKHKMADVALQRECAELAAAAAWEELRPDSAELAKIMAGRFVRTAAAECQQVLGGMGFTWEHDFHRYLRRGLMLEPVLGSASALRGALGRRLRRDGVPRLAPL